MIAGIRDYLMNPMRVKRGKLLIFILLGPAVLLIAAAGDVVVADGDMHQIRQGGSELVVITLRSDVSDSGVIVASHSFGSFPLPPWCYQPDHKRFSNSRPSAIGLEQRFSLFALPWDISPKTALTVYARLADTQYGADVRFQVLPLRNRTTRQVNLKDADIAKFCNRFDPNHQITGDAVTRFLTVARDWRARDDQTLRDLGKSTEPRFLWSEPFLRQPGSAQGSDFAEAQTYRYRGRALYTVVHFGVDLVSTRTAEVVAANSGRVIWASDLGTYGKCVVVDHGCGLQSVYTGLSEIAVRKGDFVKRGDALGRTGESGMETGDHVHFAIQVEGVPVRPLEWWDEHWVNDHIRRRVALPSRDSATQPRSLGPSSRVMDNRLGKIQG
jgi:murein DD-endopeptidase MepM/ murein hydrolase activator NlpD